MSEATTRAYAAAAEALKLNVLAYGGTLLDLDVFTERLVESAEDPHGVDIVVEIRPGLEITFPLVTTSMKEWRRRVSPATRAHGFCATNKISARNVLNTVQKRGLRVARMVEASPRRRL